VVAQDPGAAYAVCLRLARAHYENFPVASWFLPKPMRPHIAAIYAFARIADDFADEGDVSDVERLANLDAWQLRLRSAERGTASDDGTEAGAVFVALAETIATCRLDVTMFDDLLSAFRQDVTVRGYDTWDDLLDYCRRSANPVGRLVLSVAGIRDAAADRASDAACTALQLTNFWQDVERDWQKQRVYMPISIQQAHGACRDDLANRRVTPEWRAAFADVASRTRALFAAGRPVADAVNGRLRWELRATWLGGTRILDRLERVNFDVFATRPTLSWRDVPPIAWHTIAWRLGHS
jgi:squalene synthase HpnC